jgi:iron-sulfur cluster repair protein YtfE (RIC family)
LLSERQQDLRQHLHLENNILFPRALKLEREVERFIDVL